MRTVVIGTRRSELAVTQTQWVMNQLQGQLPSSWEMKQERIVTKGDQILNVTLSKVGGKGLFVKEIEQALLDGRIDLAVHSMKDMPAEMPKGLTFGAITEREDARDCLISRTGARLEELPQGAIVGTSSLRRQAQILALRPDLDVKPVRGNLQTRMKKMMDEKQFDALVLAQAGINRLGWEEKVTQVLIEEKMLPAVGQGALAVQCREDDHEIIEILKSVHDEKTAAAIQAERVFLHAFEGGCHLPIAGHAVREGGEIRLRGLVADPSGSPLLQGEAKGTDPAEVGRTLTSELMDKGARELLNQVKEEIEG
ncbi:hydroxymethylbilane synthase [Marininema halotolerans]|uniref:Porphobilinogen deaminase n=1 Tax=Marininema halotolerans TaxID=1155944 RepID=A0A1I6UCX1_9BACL|nr:hydroxymethylbilane synthase [Marininema halotolerans]SFS99228.1 hydroxymethylbilane synthase [Marininema halotolerans]